MTTRDIFVIVMLMYSKMLLSTRVKLVTRFMNPKQFMSRGLEVFVIAHFIA